LAFKLVEPASADIRFHSGNVIMNFPPPTNVAVSGQDVTGLLIAWSNGNQDALTMLVPMIYTELRRIARRYMRREASDRQTLETTALVHEAYLRLTNHRENDLAQSGAFFRRIGSIDASHSG
jgi:hypothetical protein